MLRYIAGVIVLGVGAYLLDDANSSNKRARKDYYDTCNEAEEWVEHVVNHVQKKDTLDKLFKMKKTKRKVADAIYKELKKVNEEFNVINRRIKASKKLLNELFEQKRATEERAKKRAYQDEINKVQAVRKELFAIKESLYFHQKELKSHLKLANQATRMVQDEINMVLD
jgi:flagellar biosynthesis GTPase FlhF